MTNAEKYKTAKERENAFSGFCIGHGRCSRCPLGQPIVTFDSCPFRWLELEADKEEKKDNEKF